MTAVKVELVRSNYSYVDDLADANLYVELGSSGKKVESVGCIVTLRFGVSENGKAILQKYDVL